MVYEIPEVISLLVVLGGYPLIILDFRRHRNLLPFFVAYTLLVLGTASTVLEGFYFESIFNFVEHFFGIMTAGLAFALTAYLSNRQIERAREKGRKAGEAIR